MHGNCNVRQAVPFSWQTDDTSSSQSGAHGGLLVTEVGRSSGARDAPVAKRNNFYFSRISATNWSLLATLFSLLKREKVLHLLWLDLYLPNDAHYAESKIRYIFVTEKYGDNEAMRLSLLFINEGGRIQNVFTKQLKELLLEERNKQFNKL